MNNRQFDIISLAVDLEIDKLLEETENAWYGERRNYGTRTGNGRDRGRLPGEVAGEREETQTASVQATGQIPATTNSPPRSKAPNFYGPPE